MLKLFFGVSVFTLIMGGFLSAQTLSIGPVAGANFMTITNTPLAKSKIGLSVGGFANYSINEHLGVNFKALFSQMGTKIKDSDFSVSLNYIHVPVSIVYFFGNIGNVIRPKLYAGTYASFLLNSTDKNGKNIVLPNGNDLYFKTDFGVVFGTGFNYSLGSRTWLNIDAAYSTGFYTVTDVTDSSNRNTGFQISAGISFPIGE